VGAWRLRPGVADDARPLAELYLRARRAAVPSVPPLVHDDGDVRRWMAEVVVVEHDVWVAEDAGCELRGLLVLDGEWVDQLYVDPGRTGEGIGSALLEEAKRQRPRLELWTFQSNAGAQRFYERHGFEAVERTDGRDNEERSPDVRYAWPQD
jgi:GNAT superfamily N-acetyltransferase